MNTQASNTSRGGGVIVAIVVGILCLGCLAALNDSSKPSGKSSSGAAAVPAKQSMACEHFRNIQGDITAGILTDAELRSKISEVRDSATSPAVQKAATHMLAGITQRDKTEMFLGYAELDTACK